MENHHSIFKDGDFFLVKQGRINKKYSVYAEIPEKLHGKEGRENSIIVILSNVGNEKPTVKGAIIRSSLKAATRGLDRVIQDIAKSEACKLTRRIEDYQINFHCYVYD